jgi:hypothetical protein
MAILLHHWVKRCREARSLARAVRRFRCAFPVRSCPQ